MNGWIDECSKFMNKRTNERTNKQTNKQTKPRITRSKGKA